MKLIRIILKLKKYFDYYNIYNGVIDDKYHFTSLKSENFDVVFYDEKDFCYRIIDKNMRGRYSFKKKYHTWFKYHMW